jgi:secernin
MCDLMVALPDVTKNQRTVFGKNSDRPAGECQILYYSDKFQLKDEKIQCSYITLPNNEMKYSSMGLRPYWCWGYETGMNELGVIGGNAAIFTRSLHVKETNKEPGLTGMDLLRLGLEQGATAEEVVDQITRYLEKYGQWGSAVQGKNHAEGSYENAFLIADAREAWILETAGKRWISRKITEGIYTLSNQPTIRSQYDKASTDIEEYAAEKGWWNKKDEKFDFAFHYGDHEHYSRQVSNIRWKRSNKLVEKDSGHIDIHTMIRTLRDHYEDTFLDGPLFNAFYPDFLTLCMHKSPADFTWGNTATSMVYEIPDDNASGLPFWLCYQPPCSGVYLPLWFDKPIPESITATGTEALSNQKPETAPSDRFNKRSLWWRNFRILNAVGMNYSERYPELHERYHTLEKAVFEQVVQPSNKSSDNDDFSRYVLEQYQGIISQFEKDWDLE